MHADVGLGVQAGADACGRGAGGSSRSGCMRTWGWGFKQERMHADVGLGVQAGADACGRGAGGSSRSGCMRTWGWGFKKKRMHADVGLGVQAGAAGFTFGSKFNKPLILISITNENFYHCQCENQDSKMYKIYILCLTLFNFTTLNLIHPKTVKCPQFREKLTC